MSSSANSWGERAVSGRTAGAPIEVFFGAQRELARRVYVSALGAGGRAREGAVLYAIDATEQKALEQKFAQSHKMEAVGKLAGLFGLIAPLPRLRIVS